MSKGQNPPVQKWLKTFAFAYVITGVSVAIGLSLNIFSNNLLVWQELTAIFMGNLILLPLMPFFIAPDAAVGIDNLFILLGKLSIILGTFATAGTVVFPRDRWLSKLAIAALLLGGFVASRLAPLSAGGCAYSL